MDADPLDYIKSGVRKDALMRSLGRTMSKDQVERADLNVLALKKVVVQCLVNNRRKVSSTRKMQLLL